MRGCSDRRELECLCSFSHYSFSSFFFVNVGRRLGILPLLSYVRNNVLFTSVLGGWAGRDNTTLLWVQITFCAPLILPGATEVTKKPRRWGLHFFDALSEIK